MSDQKRERVNDFCQSSLDGANNSLFHCFSSRQWLTNCSCCTQTWLIATIKFVFIHMHTDPTTQQFFRKSHPLRFIYNSSSLFSCSIPIVDYSVHSSTQTDSKIFSSCRPCSLPGSLSFDVLSDVDSGDPASP